MIVILLGINIGVRLFRFSDGTIPVRRGDHFLRIPVFADLRSIPSTLLCAVVEGSEYERVLKVDRLVVFGSRIIFVPESNLTASARTIGENPAISSPRLKYPDIIFVINEDFLVVFGPASNTVTVWC